MSYCSTCGAPAGQGRFCVSCGSQLAASHPAAPAASYATTTIRTPGPGLATSEQPQPRPFSPPTDSPSPAPPATMANPFAGIPISDYVRDILAATLLLVSLALPWDFGHDATGRIDVVLITVLSVLSLLLPYLSRVGVFPPTWNPEKLRIARLLANAPYILLVLIYLLIDVVSGFGPGAPVGGAGLGAAAWLGLAGALLAAQPREAEMTDPLAGRHIALWYSITVVCGGLLACTVLVALVRFLTGTAGLGTSSPKTVAYVVIVSVALVGSVGVPLIGTIRRSAGWRLVLIPVGAIRVTSVVFLLSTQGYAGVETVHQPGYTGTLFLTAAAAAAAAPAARRAMHQQPEAQRWIAGALHALDQEVVVAAMMLVTSVAGLALVGVPATGAAIFTLIAIAVAAILSILARGALARQPLQGRGIALVVIGITVVLGLISVIIDTSQRTSTPGQSVSRFTDLLLLGLPLVTATYLIAPVSIRKFYLGSALFTAAQWQDSAVGNEAPPTTVGAPPTHAGRSVHSLAADPTTPMAVLADLAYRERALRPVVAANPAAYHDLLVWLGQLGDPAVDAALAARPR
jgi:hypothetical protein